MIPILLAILVPVESFSGAETKALQKRPKANTSEGLKKFDAGAKLDRPAPPIRTIQQKHWDLAGAACDLPSPPQRLKCKS